MANCCHSTLAWLRDKVRGRHHRALFIGLTACRRFLHLQQGKLWLSLDQRQTSPRFYYHNCARPTFVFYWACSVSSSCFKATNYLCEHYILQTVLIHTLLICLSIGSLFTINYIQHTNHWSDIIRSDSFHWCSTRVVNVVTDWLINCWLTNHLLTASAKLLGLYLPLSISVYSLHTIHC